MRLLSASATISRRRTYSSPTNSGPSISLISWSANSPTAGPLTGNAASRLEYSNSTLSISNGMIARPQGEAAPSEYQGEVSVILASFWFRLNG